MRASTNRIQIAALVLALSLLSPAFSQGGAASEKPRPLIARDFVVVQDGTGGRVALLEKTDSVTRDLGKPKRIEVFQQGSGADNDLMSANYGNLQLRFFRGPKEILFIQISSTDYSTPRGVRVGSTKNAILSAYGKPDYDGSTKDGHRVIVYSMPIDATPLPIQLEMTFVLEGSTAKELILSVPGES
jgi:hypothetical protein